MNDFMMPEAQQSFQHIKPVKQKDPGQCKMLVIWHELFSSTEDNKIIS